MTGEQGRYDRRRGRPDKPVDPNSSATARLGADLRRRRKERGLDQESAARAVGFSRSHLAAVERGDAPASEQLIGACDKYLGADGALLALHPGSAKEWEARRSTGHRTYRSSKLGAAGSGLFAVDEEGDEWRRVLVARRVPSTVDHHVVAILQRVTASHRELYHCLSSVDLHMPLAEHLSLLISLLRESVSDELRRPLASMAAETAGHAAWLAFDLGRHHSSASLYVAAREMVSQSGDQALHAYIGGFESIVALAQEKPTRAAMLLDAASGDAARSPTFTLRAWLLGLSAQAAARRGWATDVTRLLDAGERALRKQKHEDDPTWMYPFDDSRLAVQRGACFLTLRIRHPAEHAYREALGALPPSCDRRRGEVLVGLARVLLLPGDIEVEEACSLASAALRLFLRAGSVSGIMQVQSLRAQLGRWSASPPVRALTDEVSGLLGPLWA
jgi:transcriptional regulator with XRE-family HTH domain